MFEMKMDMLLLNVHGQGLELTPDPWRCENDAIDKSKAIYVQILHAVQNSFFFSAGNKNNAITEIQRIPSLVKNILRCATSR